MSLLDIRLLYALAFVVPLAAMLAATPVAARVARRLGILDHPAPSKHHLEPTPYLGGAAIAVVLAFLGGAAVGASGQLATILLSGLALAGVGLLDDRRNVGPVVKLIVEIGAGVALWLVGIRAGLFHVYALDLALTIVWVVAITNTLNLIDNMDGLAAGVAGICALTFFVIAAIGGDYLVGSFALAVAGASFGFLRYNFPPAKIFLGDTGTLLLGFLLAALGLQLDLVGENGFIRSAVPILALGVPIFDTILVVFDRIRGGRRVYVGGTDHSSHRLARMGLSPRRVALTAYGAQIVSSGLALMVLYLGSSTRLAVVAGSVVVALLGLRFFLGIERRLAEGTGETVVLAEEPTPLAVVRSDRPVDSRSE